jgi:mercuric ion transport protein
MKKFPKLSLLFSMLFASNFVFGQAPAAETGIIDRIITFWPFVVVLVLLLLAVLWYQNIKTMRKGRETGRRRSSGLNPIVLLGFVTVFAVILLALPWYLNTLEDKMYREPEAMEIAPENRIQTTFVVEGMTCTGCENAIQKRVSSLPGIELVEADHVAMQTMVVFDKSKVTEESITQAIIDAGYAVTGKLRELN